MYSSFSITRAPHLRDSAGFPPRPCVSRHQILDAPRQSPRLRATLHTLTFNHNPQVIIGRRNAKLVAPSLSLISTSTQPTSLPSCGAHRETGLSTLTSRIWLLLKSLPALSSPTEICIFVALLRLVSKMRALPEEDEERETIRVAYAWGAAAAADMMDGNEATMEQKNSLQASCAQLGVSSFFFDLPFSHTSSLTATAPANRCAKRAIPSY